MVSFYERSLKRHCLTAFCFDFLYWWPPKCPSFLAAGITAHDIACMGITTQRNTFLTWDRSERVIISKLRVCSAKTLFSSCHQYSIPKLCTIWLFCSVHVSCDSRIRTICIMHEYISVQILLFLFSGNIMTLFYILIHYINKNKKIYQLTHWTYMPVLNTIYKCM